MAVDEAIGRIDHQISASAIWLELDGDGGEPMDRLLERLNGDAGAGRYSAVVAGPLALVDALSARLTDPAITLLIDGDEAERAAALAVACRARRGPHFSESRPIEARTGFEVERQVARSRRRWRDCRRTESIAATPPPAPGP